MYSMIATAPKSVQQRRRLQFSSPKQRPSKDIVSSAERVDATSTISSASSIGNQAGGIHTSRHNSAQSDECCDASINHVALRDTTDSSDGCMGNDNCNSNNSNSNNHSIMVVQDNTTNNTAPCHDIISSLIILNKEEGGNSKETADASPLNSADIIGNDNANPFALASEEMSNSGSAESGASVTNMDDSGISLVGEQHIVEDEDDDITQHAIHDELDLTTLSRDFGETDELKNDNLAHESVRDEDSKSIKYTRSWSIQAKIDVDADDAFSDSDQFSPRLSIVDDSPFTTNACEYNTRENDNVITKDYEESLSNANQDNETIATLNNYERRNFQSPKTTELFAPSSMQELSSQFKAVDVNATTTATTILLPVPMEEEQSNNYDDEHDGKKERTSHNSMGVLRARAGGVSLFMNSNSSDATALSIAGNDDDDDDYDLISLPPRVSRSLAPEHSPLFYTAENQIVDHDEDEQGRMAGNTNGNESNNVSNSQLISMQMLQEQSHSATLPPQRNPFAHTPSLLDDCSDDEDEMTSVASSYHGRTYSCFPKRQAHRGDGSYYAYFKKQKQGKQISHTTTNVSTALSANEVATKNIQQCMLKTRHRRWTCQSALAGSHAQSDQVLDISHRVHYYPTRCVGSKSVGNTTGGETFSFHDDEVTILARLSVPGAAIRAAALASGLWRTVRLVRLPRGLFGWHWLLWQEIHGLRGWEFRSKGYQEMDGGIEDSDVWSLLRMLGETFPMMDQIDFGGDVANSDKSLIQEDGELNYENISSKKDTWKKEIRLRIIKCLPNVIVIDGFDVAKEALDAESIHDEIRMEVEDEEGLEPNTSFDRETSMEEVDLNLSSDKHLLSDRYNNAKRQNEEVQNNSTACIVCDSVEVSMCGWSDLVGSQSRDGLLGSRNDTSNATEHLQDYFEESTSGIGPGQCDIAVDISSDAIEDVSENLMSLVENSVAFSSERISADQNEIKSSTCGPDTSIASKSNDSDDNFLPNSPTSSSLLSSRSWNSSGSGNRPPTCPTSTSRLRLPRKPTDDKKSNKSVTKARSWKRRVLGLIPTVSVMDEDEEDDDGDDENDDDNDDIEDVDDCPHDIL